MTHLGYAAQNTIDFMEQIPMWTAKFRYSITRMLVLSFALPAAPAFALAAEENVTPRLRGALVEFESGAKYAFYPRGSFLVTREGKSWRGKWSFKRDRSAYCGPVPFSTGTETSCNKIVKRGEHYIEVTEAGGDSPITAIKFNHFKK